jgi:hypothetical protein
VDTARWHGRKTDIGGSEMTRPGWWALALVASGLVGAAALRAQADVQADKPIVTVYKTPT